MGKSSTEVINDIGNALGELKATTHFDGARTIQVEIHPSLRSKVEEILEQIDLGGFEVEVVELTVSLRP